ncbi:MAG: hypothetical protein M1821_003033 [Bathelium mastoideum]|nr:MAG: hypothetical protein M1821_003033 [Bathelium mastoideum]KAI9681923.1 MAG: hypothetical protein M1822_007000 [Bathelium mastoideum]
MQPWCLVSPASRGIGFELARLLLQRTNAPIVATARKDLDQMRHNILNGLGKDAGERLNVLQLDVIGSFNTCFATAEAQCITNSDKDEESIASASSACQRQLSLNPKEAYLHLSFCIPGILFPEKSPSQVDADNALLTYRTNTLGPLLTIKHFEKFLPTKNTNITSPAELAAGNEGSMPRSAVWANMSARVGSITDNRLGGWFSYRSSKAAVNQLTKTFDNRLQTRSGEKAMAISLHPGTVKTGLSKEFWGNVKEDKLFSPQFAAERLVEVVGRLDIENRGKFWDWEGKEIPP